jgi:DNA-binding NarL/FixJ family response regulator
MIRILLSTDEPALGRGLVAILSPIAGCEVVWICQSPLELVEKALAAGKPELLLIDVTPDVTLGLLSGLQRELPECRVVLWVRSISTTLAYQAIQLGVRGILRKTLAPELVVECLDKVSQGGLWLDNHLMESLLSVKMVALTRRETQLVTVLAQGLSNKEIAATLSISEGTVKVYLSRLFHKVGAKDRFELALHGLRNLHDMSGGPRVMSAMPQPDGLKPPAARQWLPSQVLEVPCKEWPSRPGSRPPAFSPLFLSHSGEKMPTGACLEMLRPDHATQAVAF